MSDCPGTLFVTDNGEIAIISIITPQNRAAVSIISKHGTVKLSEIFYNA